MTLTLNLNTEQEKMLADEAERIGLPIEAVAMSKLFGDIPISLIPTKMHTVR